MSWPQRLLWLSIYLVAVLSLLVQCNNALEVSTETSATTSKSVESAAEENYEMIDVAQRERESNQQVQTGQTTRILTSGDVDDQFWLKHLGDDFKYAIHLQVGENNQYDGIYNMTEDGANYEVQQDNRTKKSPVNSNDNGKQNESKTDNDETLNFTNSSTSDNKMHTVNGDFNVTSYPIQPNDDNGFEQVFSLGADGVTLIKNLRDIQTKNENHNKNIQIQHNKYNSDNPKTQNINIKLIQKSKDTTTDRNNNDSPSKPWNSQASPIVVTLSQDDITDENTPVVVKMPPVIYHHSDEPTSDQLTSPETQQFSNSEQNFQYTQPPPSQQQQHEQHEQYEPTHYTAYNLHSPHSLSTIPSQPYYTPNLLEDSTTYNTHPAYTSPIATPISPINPYHREELQKSTDSIRLILRKPTTPYNGSPDHNQIPLENIF